MLLSSDCTNAIDENRGPGVVPPLRSHRELVWFTPNLVYRSCTAGERPVYKPKVLGLKLLHSNYIEYARGVHRKDARAQSLRP